MEPRQPECYSDRSERELIAMAKAGADKAFEELVRRTSPRILSLCARILGSREHAWDVAQEAYLAAWKAMSGFRGEATFYTWVRRIALNACLADLRRRQRIVTIPLHSHPGEDSEDGSALAVEEHLAALDTSDPAEALGRLEVRHAVEDAIRGLPEHYRIAFWLREVEGMSYRDIALALGLSEGTVKSRLYTAKRLLRERLEEEGKWNMLATN